MSPNQQLHLAPTMFVVIPDHVSVLIPLLKLLSFIPPFLATTTSGVHWWTRLPSASLLVPSTILPRTYTTGSPTQKSRTTIKIQWALCKIHTVSRDNLLNLQNIYSCAQKSHLSLDKQRILLTPHFHTNKKRPNTEHIVPFIWSTAWQVGVITNKVIIIT